ncbi:hypothetical protein CYY_003575 [Polysphondylium violaceum]|uniref:Uncharacterized protein n=1 Tax=Polysphondylium violaceum TaxID=133409 RepID=A0A8J4PXI9_9MYCE|nr:hypothetical protein CYY_003575 [Polysphondylium violaceum]
MRLKVAWKDNKLVIPSGNGDDKVSRLLKDIATKFASYSADATDFIISELKTSDGYTISPHSAIKDSIVESDYLVAIDFETWKNDQFKLCTKSWMSGSVTNFKDDTTISVGVGLHTQNKLYISISQYKKLFRLELFDASDLQDYHKEGKHLICHWEDDSQETYARVYFNVKGKVVDTVELEIKVASSARPTIKSLPITITSPTKIAPRDVVIVQEAYSKYDVESNFKAPEETREGESYPDYDMDYYVTEGGNGGDASTFANVTGASGIKFEQIDITRSECSQHTTSNNTFFNSFYTDFQIVNTTEKKITLTKLTGEYQKADGEWAPIPAFFGTKRGGAYDYSWRWEPALVLLESRDTIKLSTNLRIEIPGSVSERLVRSHPSLPSEINFRATIKDDLNNTTVIPFVYKNKTPFPVFATLKYVQQRNPSDNYVFFQTVDNKNTVIRGRVSLIKKMEGSDMIYNLTTSFSNYSHYIRESSLHSFAYKASVAKESKYRIPDYCSENRDFKNEIFAIVDLDSGKVQALCSELKSVDGGNVSTKYFPIGKFEAFKN